MPSKLNPILQVMADNRQTAGRRFEVRASADGEEAEIFLYDAIVDDELDAEWWGGVAPQGFIKQLRAITANTIHLRINSPGGSVFAARTIETALREHKARVVVHIDGLAASSASFIAMAGDEIVIAKGAMVMIHKAWTWAWGNADDLGKTVGLLDKIDGTLVQTYVDRTGQTAEQISAWMQAETWFTGEEAVESGFADRLSEDGDAPSETQASDGEGGAQPAARLQWNLNAYLQNQGRRPAPEVHTSAPEQDDENQEHRERQLQRLRAMQITEIAA